MVGIILGASLMLASIVAFVVALPRAGQVRPFLRNDHVQSYYTIGMLGVLLFGIVKTVTGIVALVE